MQAGKGEIVEQMGELLEEAGMRDVLPLPKARVPVVKFVADTSTKVRPSPAQSLVTHKTHQKVSLKNSWPSCLICLVFLHCWEHCWEQVHRIKNCDVLRLVF